MKLFLKIMVSIIVIFVLIVAGGMFYITRGLDSGSRLNIESIKLSSVEDGSYNGRYEGGRWTNEVKVTVKDHKIISIDVMKDVTFAKPELTQQLFNSIIQRQSNNIEVVSGATVTSKAYLKSIENALSGEVKK